MKKFQCFFAAMLLMVVSVLSGCGGSSKEEVPEGIVRVAFISAYVSDDEAKSYAATMAERSEEVNAVEYQTLSIGGESDPMMYSTAIMKIAALVTSNEVDVFIYDKNEAARDARSDMFYPMDEIFTSEELALMEGKLLSYPMVDDEGVETGEMTVQCGLDVSGDEALAKVLNTDEIGIFVVGNAQNIESVKALVLSYVK